MATILKTKSIYYNDCNLIAQPSHVDLKSRTDIPRELFRIIVSPMDAIVGKTFAVEAANLGLTVCLHRFCTPKDQLEIFKSIADKSRIYVSIGINDWDRVKMFKDHTSNWLIDCANGYLRGLTHSICELISNAKVDKLMVGNIHTKEGIRLFGEFDSRDMKTSIRVGLAGGAACSTSDATGVNRGQITEIMECTSEADLYNNLYVIADGGIKNGNYAAKAFGAGAHYVMMGSYFSKAIEAETNVIGDGTYWGGASYKQQTRYGGIRRHSEGKVITSDEPKKPLKDLVDELWGGLSSTISYSGYNLLTDFIGNGVFEIKENSLPPKLR
jgi:IMP dehydrogenase/GMP reductase